jgi:hypothetical protein
VFHRRGVLETVKAGAVLAGLGPSSSPLARANGPCARLRAVARPMAERALTVSARAAGGVAPERDRRAWGEMFN